MLTLLKNHSNAKAMRPLIQKKMCLQLQQQLIFSFMSFSVDYTSRSCKLYSSTIQNTNLLSRLDSALYEKTCLQDRK